MKKFGVIFQYEIMNYIKNKSFMISTIVIAVLAAVILFLPSVFDMSGILGIKIGRASCRERVLRLV